jgi:hypothetical protein
MQMTKYDFWKFSKENRHEHIKIGLAADLILLLLVMPFVLIFSRLAVVIVFFGIPLVPLALEIYNRLAKKFNLPKGLVAHLSLDFFAAKAEIFYASPLRMLLLTAFTAFFALPWLWPEGGFSLQAQAVSIVFLAIQLLMFFAWKAVNFWIGRYEKALAKANEAFIFNEIPSTPVPTPLIILFYAILIPMGFVVILSVFVDLYFIWAALATAAQALL